MEIKYPLAKETINEEDIEALIQWLKTYPRLTQGQLTKDFEEAWAKYIGTKYACFCNSGSSANLLMFNAAIEANKFKNKKIIVPSVGWVTTIAPIIQAGYEPIMIDADEKTYGIDLQRLEEVCKKEDPAGVIFVQVLGVPHYKEELLELQQKYGFYLMEDSCAALGARYMDGTKVGKVGNASSFSFYFGHQLSTIEGGMVNTDDHDLYQSLMMLRSHGWGKDLDPDYRQELISQYEVDDFHSPFTFFTAGYNLRPTDLQAFIGLRQVEKAEHMSFRRYENHARYAENLRGYFRFQEWFEHMPVSISFGALAGDTEHRKMVVKKLVEHGIETRIFSAGNLGLHPFWYNRYGKFEGEISNEIHHKGFFLPNYPELKTDEIDMICEVCKNAV